MRSLRQDQTAALNQLRQAMLERDIHVVMQAPTGFGKTVLGAEIVSAVLRKGKKITFAVPSLALIDQTVEMFAKHGINDVGVIQQNHRQTDGCAPVQVASVQTMMKRVMPDFDVLMIDECHKWFTYYEKHMRTTWLNKAVIGLSATPWTKGLGGYFSRLIKASTTQELIDGGLLSDFKVWAPSDPDLAGIRTVAGDYDEHELSNRMRHGGLTADIVHTWLEQGRGRPTLCFAVDRAHAEHLRSQFEAAGVRVVYQDAYTSDLDRAAIKRGFHDKSDNGIEVVVNIGTLTTGVDWDVRCIILARPTKSEMLFCLDTETEVLTSHGWRGIGQVKEGDCAAALVDPETGKGCWSKVIGVVDREMGPNEQWVSYEAPRANFRVTGDHTMIYRTSHDRPFQRASALEMAGIRDGVQTPTAIEIDQPGVPLTDAELYFLGMMMTDGTWTATHGSISQSERHPEIIERIEACLQGCEIGYAKRRVSPAPLNAAISERHPRWAFHISAGTPKSVRLGKPMAGNAVRHQWQTIQGITGYRHLLPFMDKDFAPALMAVSKSQFLVLLQGIHDGDGFKMKSPSINWTPRSWKLCSGRKIFIERLQALAAINGFTAHLRSEQGERKNPIWYLTITPQHWRNIGGCGRRPQITISSVTKERVWCIQTEAGTIVTRRHGKVTVMGNCQIVGRGLRTAPGKSELIILDHSKNHKTLGFVTDIDAAHNELSQGRERVAAATDRIRLPKMCPACSFMKPPGMATCPACGFVAVKHNKIEPTTGELKELKRKEVEDLKQRKLSEKEHRRLEKERANYVDRPLFFSELRAYGLRRGYADGWAAVQYKEKVGHWPEREIENIAPAIEISPATAGWIKNRLIRWAKGKGAAAKSYPQFHKRHVDME